MVAQHCKYTKKKKKKYPELYTLKWWIYVMWILSQFLKLQKKLILLFPHPSKVPLSPKHQIKARYGLVDLGLLALLNPATSILAIPSLESYRPALTKQLAHFWSLGSSFSRAKNSGVSHLFGKCFPRNTGKAAKEAFSSHWPPGVIGAGSSKQSINHASHCVHGGQEVVALDPQHPSIVGWEQLPGALTLQRGSGLPTHVQSCSTVRTKPSGEEL